MEVGKDTGSGRGRHLIQQPWHCSVRGGLGHACAASLATRVHVPGLLDDRARLPAELLRSSGRRRWPAGRLGSRRLARTSFDYEVVAGVWVRQSSLAP